MATKKQKRLNSQAKHEEKMAKIAESGRKAQLKDQEIRAARRERRESDEKRANQRLERRQKSIMAMSKIRGTT